MRFSTGLKELIIFMLLMLIVAVVVAGVALLFTGG